MRIIIATTHVPFVKGGAETLVEMLRQQLVLRGHEAEIVKIPFKWYPDDSLIDSMIMFRAMDLNEFGGQHVDLVIAMKFPAFYIKHPNKVVWLMHQHRQAYDLWGTEYGDMHKFADPDVIRKVILENDSRYLREAKRIYTISANVSDRLKRYNGIDSVPLYCPPADSDKLHCSSYGDFMLYPSRVDLLKRQDILMDAAKYLKTKAKIVITGNGLGADIERLKNKVKKEKLEDRVKYLGFVPTAEKIDLYSRCLGVYFGAYNEDLGYVTTEAFFSKKPVIVHKDSGGPLEFVRDGYNGFVVDTSPEDVASSIDKLFLHKELAKKMGEQGLKSLKDKKVDWDHVIGPLLKK